MESEHLPQHGSASSYIILVPMVTKISTKIANWQPTYENIKGKNVKNLLILGRIINELSFS